MIPFAHPSLVQQPHQVIAGFAAKLVKALHHSQRDALLVAERNLVEGLESIPDYRDDLLPVTTGGAANVIKI